MIEGEENKHLTCPSKEKLEKDSYHQRRNKNQTGSSKRYKRITDEDLILVLREFQNDTRHSIRELQYEMRGFIREVKDDLKRLSYRNMVVENILLASTNKPIQVIPFSIGEGPNEDELPLIINIISISNLNEEDVVSYLRGYDVDGLPPSLLAKKKKPAAMVGLG